MPAYQFGTQVAKPRLNPTKVSSGKIVRTNTAKTANSLTTSGFIPVPLAPFYIDSGTPALGNDGNRTYLEMLAPAKVVFSIAPVPNDFPSPYAVIMHFYVEMLAGGVGTPTFDFDITQHPDDSIVAQSTVNLGIGFTHHTIAGGVTQTPPTGLSVSLEVLNFTSGTIRLHAAWGTYS